MARFRFPLQALLHLRERAERDEQVAFGELENERVAIGQSLERMNLNIERAQQDARVLLEAGSEPLDLNAARWQANAAMHMQGVAGQLAVSLEGAEARSKEQRERLLRASVARRALERLRERRLDEWMIDQRRKEQLEMDDLGTSRAARRVKGF